MKRPYLSGLILSGIILCAGLYYANAAETRAEDEFIWTEPGPEVPQAKDGFRWFRLTDEAIERIMKTVKEKDPAKAEQLERLRSDDTDAFENELRKIMPEYFGRKRQMHRQRGMWPEHGPPPKGAHKEHMRPEFGHPDVNRPYMRQKYLKWLEETHPEKAVELENIRDENPELFKKRLQRGMGWHRRLMRAAKENPKLAEALKQSRELRTAEKGLLEKIAAAKTKEEKQAATKQLQETISKRFDLIVKRKQIIYKLQKKRIALMQERLEKIAKAIEKWQQPAFKAAAVRKKMEKLNRKAEQFKGN